MNFASSRLVLISKLGIVDAVECGTLLGLQKTSCPTSGTKKEQSAGI